MLGGSGYVEDSGMPRLYREAPVYSIWEGSGNVVCLDVRRALRRTPETAAALGAELALARGGDRRLDRRIDRLLGAAGGELPEAGLRTFCRELTVVLQAALLVRHAPAFVAEAFLASRLEGAGAVFGMLPDGLDLAGLVARASPEA